MKITNHTLGPKCVKRTTICIIVTDDGETYIGSNAVENPQTECPRANMLTETGYEVCKTLCRQYNHAEAAAAKQVPPGKTGIAILVGHDHACKPCQDALETVGVRELVVIDINAR